MLQGSVILLVASAYLGALFAIAYFGDRRAEQGRSIINNPYIYTLSIAVYCTAWTFYGSVGRAAAGGIGFLPIYLGPTLMACLWWFVLRKMLRITKAYGITSIADFVASRYGKSALLGGLVTIVAVFGIMPYISLQLKAVSTSVEVILDYPAQAPFWRDLALYVALLLAAFSILFGTRHIDATEHHQGMVAAIAFESIVKLVAFVTVGLFVTFGLYDGFGDIFDQAIDAGFGELLTFEGSGLSFADWFALTCLAGMAILFLPRQFQVAVIENINEDHLNKAIWLFPLYLLVINLFVLPIALAGLLRFPARRRRHRLHGAAAADGRAAAPAHPVHLPGRPLGGDRHGDRRDGRAQHHAVQRPDHAGAAAPALAAPERAAGPLRPAARDPARQHPRACCCSATPISRSSASPTRWSPSGWCRSAPPPSSRRRSCSASTGRRRRCAAR